MRDGIYSGKFFSSLNGVTVRSYPGEWAAIDGYYTTTLAAPINSTQKNITLADGSRISNGQDATVHDGQEGLEEVIHFGGKGDKAFGNCQRGWNGTRAVPHGAGAMVVLGGNQLTVGGNNSTYMDFEIRNSDPVRQQLPANSQNAPHLRGEGVFNTGSFNKFINLVIHDTQDGFFNSPRAVGTEVYGCIVFNNGYIAGSRDNGHGLYLIHGSRRHIAYMKENIVFNNSAIGIKGDSQNGDTVNVWTEGTVSFNNGSWNQTNNRRFGILMGANNGVADMITIKDCFLYNPSRGGSQISLGYGGLNNGSANVTGNYIGGGGQALIIQKWTPFTFTKNTVHARQNLGPGNSEMILYVRSPDAAETWNGNSYWNQINGSKGYYFGPGSASATFPEWQTKSGFDSSSTETEGVPPNKIFVRPNAYQKGRAHIIIYNWSLAHTVTIDLSTSGLATGQAYEIRSVQNYLGGPVHEGVYNSASPNISLIMSGPVVAPLGRTSLASTFPEFGVFVVIAKV